MIRLSLLSTGAVARCQVIGPGRQIFSGNGKYSECCVNMLLLDALLNGPKEIPASPRSVFCAGVFIVR